VNIKLYDHIMNLFGKERAALYSVEIQHLVDKGYNEREIRAFLENYALPIGVFYALSMLQRSRLDVNDLEKSLAFLFNRHVTVAEIMKRHLKPNCRILDFGCGRGLLSCFLAMKNFDVYGVDASADTLKIAEKLAEKLGCKPRFRLIKENDFPFVDEYFDAILCVWVLHEVSQDEIRKISEELHRILRKKGSVFIIDQKEVAPFEIIKTSMSQSGFKLDLEENLSPVYDHGKTSQALLLKYVRK
jgi:2-polyprenyl-3-methyl-5-hydroxy-6-metoxy-1,4-benzoquinol methylase